MIPLRGDTILSKGLKILLPRPGGLSFLLGDASGHHGLKGQLRSGS
jgi:hypothetical protein